MAGNPIDRLELASKAFRSARIQQAAGGLHPLQRTFLEDAALQCGVCTPGFIVAAKALLDEDPNPSEEQIRRYLANNLCRCTGYDKIVRAIQHAAGMLQEAKA